MFKYELYITLVRLKCIANTAAPGLLFLEPQPATRVLLIARFYSNATLQMANQD